MPSPKPQPTICVTSFGGAHGLLAEHTARAALTTAADTLIGAGCGCTPHEVAAWSGDEAILLRSAGNTAAEVFVCALRVSDL